MCVCVGGGGGAHETLEGRGLWVEGGSLNCGREGVVESGTLGFD